MMYAFVEYDGNVGIEEWYEDIDEALKHAEYSWNHTTEREKSMLIESCVLAFDDDFDTVKDKVANTGGWLGDFGVLVWEKGKRVD